MCLVLLNTKHTENFDQWVDTDVPLSSVEEGVADSLVETSTSSDLLRKSN